MTTIMLIATIGMIVLIANCLWSQIATPGGDPTLCNPIEMVFDLVNNVVTTIVSVIPGLIIDFVTQFIPKLIDMVVDIVEKIVTAIF